MGMFSKFFRRAERSIYFGRVIRSFGVLDQRRQGITRFKVEVFWCEKGGRKYLVSRQSTRTPLGRSVTYHYVSEDKIPKLKQAVDESFLLMRR